MTDKELIERLERDNSQLKQALRRFLTYVTYGNDFEDAAERNRKRAQAVLEEAEIFDQLKTLLK